MPTSVISPGPVTPMLQNVIYALPASRTRIFTSDSSPTIEQSNDPAFANNVVVILLDGMNDLAGGFIRCTSGNISVSLKKF